MDPADIPAVTGETDPTTPAAAPETPAGRDKRGRFAKGAPSANPRGRPTESHELKILAREKSPEAIKRLLFWLRSGDSTASIAAAKELLSRGYGRPEQGITLDATVNHSLAFTGEVRDVSDPTEVARLYQEMMGAGAIRDPRSVNFVTAPKSAMPALEPPPPPQPSPRAEPTEVLQAPTSPAAPAAGPREQPSAPPARSPPAVDPEDPSVVAIVDEPLRHFHEHRPKADSTCPRCRQMWVAA